MERLGTPNLLRDARVYLSGPMDFVASREAEKKFGWRNRVSDERSNTNACWKNASPQKYWKYGFSTQRSHKASSERS